jgi:MoaA/NifB/PqqE/SkfB family radical SAM enzyme
MTPEQQKAIDDASIPFWQGGGAISIAETKLKSWRYFLEINSLCSLHCPTCTKGDETGYDHLTGIMQPDLMEKILDKIQSENSKAIVFCYGNSEPFLHPKLPECIAAIKRRGLNAQMSTNLNSVRRLDDLLAAKPDMIIISLSGFTQDIYVRGHAGGNIEKVKANMRLIAEANGRLIQKEGGGPGVDIQVNYHLYSDNQHEAPLMKEFCKNLGIGFFTSYARAISMENAIQYCRLHDPEATPFEVQPGRPDWNTELPPSGKIYQNAMKRLVKPPTMARAMYGDVPMASVCPVGAGSIFTFIRHDGKTQLCACVADRRIILKDYLDTTPDELIVQREGHAICKQCIKYRLNLYFMIAGHEQWTPPI